jgi:hypothetical protein
MSPSEALSDIGGYAAAHRITLTRHAERRAQQRGAQYEDIRHGLMTASRCTWQENGCWRVIATDREGDELILIVALDGEDIIVTLF